MSPFLGMRPPKSSKSDLGTRPSGSMWALLHTSLYIVHAQSTTQVFKCTGCCSIRVDTRVANRSRPFIVERTINDIFHITYCVTELDFWQISMKKITLHFSTPCFFEAKGCGRKRDQRREADGLVDLTGLGRISENLILINLLHGRWSMFLYIQSPVVSEQQPKYIHPPKSPNVEVMIQPVTPLGFSEAYYFICLLNVNAGVLGDGTNSAQILIAGRPLRNQPLQNQRHLSCFRLWRLIRIWRHLLWVGLAIFVSWGRFLRNENLFT